MLTLQRLHTENADFQASLSKLLAWEAASNQTVVETVERILQQVRQRGDAALLEYTAEFDRHHLSSGQEFEVPQERLQKAYEHIDAKQRHALEKAAQRVTAYHQHQKQDSWQFTEEDGTMLGQQITLERVMELHL
ncbi:MAG: histidinol dehydrogenase, partial [Candidatus Electrothrix sp. AR3]|nr:histidinol dehydrogenase [Candidatus Electrothrix sp. AR3]